MTEDEVYELLASAVEPLHISDKAETYLRDAAQAIAYHPRNEHI